MSNPQKLHVPMDNADFQFKVLARLDGQNDRINKIEGRMDRLEGQVNSLKNAVNTLTSKVDKLDTAVNNILKTVDGISKVLQISTNTQGKVVDNVIDLSKTIKEIRDKIDHT